ncbi:hypothetical protein TNCV_2946281 [Trichonephila clavipes]|nr:hypothetical protein TNCV_2946281 [Trichonephila clavipes]
MGGPRDSKVFRKWPARSFGLDTPGRGRSSGEGEAEFCSKSIDVYESCCLGSSNAQENGTKTLKRKLNFKPYNLQSQQQIIEGVM